MKDFLENTWKHRAHVVLALPAFLILLFIMYVPMTGLVMAFKSFDYTKGIWASPWNGLDNFKYLLASARAAMGGNITQYSATMATVAVVIAPIMVVYPFFQKYFVKGLTVGSVKG